MSGIIFNPAGYGGFDFDGAVVQCVSCQNEWALKAQEDGSVALDGNCPVCPSTTGRIVKPGPRSERRSG